MPWKVPERTWGWPTVQSELTARVPSSEIHSRIDSGLVSTYQTFDAGAWMAMDLLTVCGEAIFSVAIFDVRLHGTKYSDNRPGDASRACRRLLSSDCDCAQHDSFSCFNKMSWRRDRPRAVCLLPFASRSGLLPPPSDPALPPPASSL